MITASLDIAIQKTRASKLPGIDFSNIPFGKLYADHMFFSEFREGAWQSPSILPFQNLSLSPATSVLHYGQAIFEGMKAFRNELTQEVMIFRPDENASRFNISAKRICMPELSDGFFLQALHELIHLDQEWVPNTQDSSLYIRPFMFASDEFIGLRPSENYQFLIFTSPVGKYYTEPVKVKVESYYTRAAEGGTGFAKTSANYAAAMYPARLAQEEGFHQLLWTDGKQHRFVEESGTMNVLFVINGKLVSIPPSETILAGIMRKSVLELARDWGLEVEERPVEVAELVKGIKDGSVQEMFGAGTAATITHISHVGHNGEVLALPPVEKREISNKIFAELTGIQRGTIADRFGWMYKIPKK